jgi:hypothetical protein
LREEDDMFMRGILLGCAAAMAITGGSVAAEEWRGWNIHVIDIIELTA